MEAGSPRRARSPSTSGPRRTSCCVRRTWMPRHSLAPRRAPSCRSARAFRRTCAGRRRASTWTGPAARASVTLQAARGADARDEAAPPRASRSREGRSSSSKAAGCSCASCASRPAACSSTGDLALSPALDLRGRYQAELPLESLPSLAADLGTSSSLPALVGRLVAEGEIGGKAKDPFATVHLRGEGVSTAAAARSGTAALEGDGRYADGRLDARIARRAVFGRRPGAARGRRAADARRAATGTCAARSVRSTSHRCSRLPGSTAAALSTDAFS